MRFARWCSEWIETLRVAPPFSARRRCLLAAIHEANESGAEDYTEVERP
jgi:hypothetical protein